MAGFFCLWLVLAGIGPGDLAMGVAAALAATGISLRLLPTGSSRIRPLVQILLVASFLLHSIFAGLDLARRAFDPRARLRPGLLLFPIRLAPGPARSTFCMAQSLLPGTLPTGFDAKGALILHGLDTDQPVLAQMAMDEALFLEALGERGRHG
jgi:multicomponent Na+:H+ antiporter subunit E